MAVARRGRVPRLHIAVLGALFAACGHPIPIDVLVLGYIIGCLANTLPVPGGFGVLEAGLDGTLVAYGAPATDAAAAVVVYHAIAFWIPSLGGLLGYALLRRRESRQREQSGRLMSHSTPASRCKPRDYRDEITRRSCQSGAPR